MLRCILVTIGIVTAVCASAVAEETVTESSDTFTRDDTTYVRWTWPVATSKDKGEQLASRIAHLNELLKGVIEPQTDHDANPGCCFWVQVSDWRPNLDEAGAYVVIIQRGGALLMATDIAQLDAAIERIANERIAKGDHVYLPLGLLTNYFVVPDGK
jgi:hypothetical protein